MNISTTQDAVTRSIEALELERQKIETAIKVLRETVGVTARVAPRVNAPVAQPEAQPKGGYRKKNDKRAQLASERLKRMWALAKQDNGGKEEKPG